MNSPAHGQWNVADQTRTDNGFELMRYNDRLPFEGWQLYDHFGSAEDAWAARDRFRDQLANGEPWPA